MEYEVAPGNIPDPLRCQHREKIAIRLSEVQTIEVEVAICERPATILVMSVIVDQQYDAVSTRRAYDLCCKEHASALQLERSPIPFCVTLPSRNERWRE